MIVGKSYVYLAIPRTGSHSMSHFLMDHWEGVPVGGHHSLDLREEDLDKTLWAVVRHPLDRLKSLFWQQNGQIKNLVNGRSRNRPPKGEVLAAWERWVKEEWPLRREGLRADKRYDARHHPEAVSCGDFLDTATRWPDKVFKYEELPLTFPSLPLRNASPKILERSEYWTIPGIVEAGLAVTDPQDYEAFNYDRAAP